MPPAHPRRCGENQTVDVGFMLICGSSPQVRGKHKNRKFSGRPLRLIPAGAGKTLHLTQKRFWPSAHPRRCGENLVSFII